MDEFPAVSLDGLSLGNDGVGEAARPAEEVDRNPVAVVVRHLRLKQSCKMSNLLGKENGEISFYAIKSAFYTDISSRFCNSGGKEVRDKLWECGSCCKAGVALLWLPSFRKLFVRNIDLVFGTCACG